MLTKRIINEIDYWDDWGLKKEESLISIFETDRKRLVHEVHLSTNSQQYKIEQIQTKKN